MLKPTRLLLLTVCAVLLGAGLLVPLAAQDDIVLTIMAQEWMQDTFDRELFADFEAAHPGVKVVFVPQSPDVFFPPAAYDIDGSLEGVTEFASTADVLMVANYQMDITSTRAGAYLDLTPLVSADTSFNENDFIPAIWESYQWEGGIWALPVSASALMVIYNAAAFDAAGLPYPTESWTLRDYADAARALIVYDENGEVLIPGMFAFNQAHLFRALTGQPFYTDEGAAAQPRLTTPELQALLEEWLVLQEEGIFGLPSGDQRFSLEDVPMIINRSYLLTNQMTDESKRWQASLLPGGTAGMDVEGFAVSGGTAYPELAYELAKYLSTRPEVTLAFFGDTPARRSMIGVEPEDGNFFSPEVPEEVQALLDRAFENAIPHSQMLFGEYVNVAINQMIQEGESAQVALEEEETRAQADLQTASDYRAESVVMVATPVPTPVLSGSEIALRFRVNANISPLPNRAEWEQLIAEFVAADPEVGHIEMLTGFGGEPDEALDCFYQSFDVVGGLNPQDPHILSLDPFLDADPNFDRNDLVPGALAKLQRENLTWGLPIYIEPQIIWYNPTAFTDANAVLPENGWTVDTFTDALRNIETSNGEPPFVSQTFQNTYLLMLMAAYGALPYDHRTDPPTINLTDPATLDAMRQVLDLAKDGLISYQQLAGGFGGGGGGMAPMYDEMLSLISWRLTNRVALEGGDDGYRLTTFPVGTQHTPISYQVGAGYIDADTLHPEACYRWLSFVSQQPEIVTGMPARRSLMNSPELAAMGEDLVALYQSLDTLMQSPNTIIFDATNPTNYIGGWIEQVWMNRAFDRYVLEDRDLEGEMQAAAENITLFRECIEPLPAYDPGLSEEENQENFNALVRCAISIDPEIRSQFPWIEEE